MHQLSTSRTTIASILFSSTLLSAQVGASEPGNIRYDPSKPEQPWQGLDNPKYAVHLNHQGVSQPVMVIQGDGTPYKKNKQYTSIRIPAAEVANDGSLVCLVQGRLAPGDRDPDHAIIMRSTDWGKTWHKNVIFKENNHTDFGDNSLVIDRTNGRLFAFIHTSKATMLYSSDDHGKSWTREPDVSREHGTVRMRGTTGIQLLEHPKQPMLLPGIIGKGDLGYLVCEAGKKQWKLLDRHQGSSQYNEPTVVEIIDGQPDQITLLNLSRVAGKDAKRKYKFASHYRINSENILEPLPAQNAQWKVSPPPPFKKINCNQHLKRYSGIGDGKQSAILYSSTTLQSRYGGTVGFSTNEGKTWKTKKIVPDKIHFAYTSQVILPDGSIGLFYETHNQRGKRVRHGAIQFIRYSVDWLMQKDAADAPMIRAK